MKKIPLAGGKLFALVDDADYDKVAAMKWRKTGQGKYTYAVSGGSKSFTWMHRLIMGTPAGMFTDHINGDRLDNRRSNLRICTHRQNGANQRRPDRVLNGQLIPKGVQWFQGKFTARINVNGRYIHLGRFATPKEAGQAYNDAAQRLHGEFASPNELAELKKGQE